ncbi:MAG: c-type cytochrome [Gammaproteobacteria bacterium]
MKCIKVIIAILILACGAFLAYIYSGVDNIAATAPEGFLTRWVLGTVRERSISTRSDTIQVPPLTDPKMIQSGFTHYDALCSACHLKSGEENSDMRAGLNPRPPALPRMAQYVKPAEAFWIIKNGIKMTGMPAWGVTQDDQTIWSIVAFMQKLPNMTAAEYQAMKQQANRTEAPSATSRTTQPQFDKPTIKLNGL